MKKIIFMLNLLISSSTCFAIYNYSSGTEALIVRDIAMDKDSIHNSVTRQPIHADSSFTVLVASLKDTSISTTALDTFSENNLNVDFFGCTLSGRNQITCLTKIVAVNQNLEISAYATGFRSKVSRLFDNLSNEYPASTVSALNKTDSGSLVFTLTQGIPVKVKFIYNNINLSATSVSLFEPLFEFSNTFVKGSFTNIDL